MLLLSAAVLGAGFGALAPAFQTLAVQSAPPSRAGVATSTYFWSLDISVGLAAALLGMAANAFGYPFMYGVICLSSSLHAVWFLRLVHGAVFALGTTASAAMAALVLPRRRKGEGIGYFAVCGNMAMVIGPLVGLLIMDYLGAHPLFIFLSLLAIGAIAAGNGKKLPSAVILPGERKRAGFHLGDFIEKRALPSVILGGLVFFAYGGVLTFIPMYTRSLGLGSSTSLFFLVFALVIVVTRPFVGYLFDHHGPNATVYPGFLLFLSLIHI